MGRLRADLPARLSENLSRGGCGIDGHSGDFSPLPDCDGNHVYHPHCRLSLPRQERQPDSATQAAMAIAESVGE